MKKFIPAVILTLSLWGVPAAYAAEIASAQTTQAAPIAAESANWAAQVTPYLWAAGLDGRISPFRRGPTVGVDKSFSDVLEDLKIGGFIDIWGRYDRYVLSGDVIYVHTTENHASGPLPAVGPIPPGSTLDGKIDTKLFMATMLGGYRIVDTPAFTLDALGGVRFWHVSNKARVNTLGLSRNHKESFGWAEPVIGARAFMSMTDKLSWQVHATIGGFGAGSEFAWSALATINYTLSDKLSVSAGYKVLDVDYDHKGHVYDTRLSGPVLGLTYRF